MAKQSRPSAPINLETDVPVVLFPVRIETKFNTITVGTASSAQLLVRIYPDDIHIDSHEAALTLEEEKWGKFYWNQVWNNRNSVEIEQSAWAQLVSRFQSARSSWIINRLKPTNHNINPSAGKESNPVFPSIGLKNDSWTRAPFTKVLPDRWTVVGYSQGKKVFEVMGAEIGDELHTGPAPEGQKLTPNGDGPMVDKNMQWMIDFDEAVRVGMGLRIPLSEQLSLTGLDQLIVFGVKTSLGSVDGAKRLAELLDAHHYTDGLAFISQGTPTNNTEAGVSGFAARERDPMNSFAIERQGALLKPGDDNDGEIVAKSLGVPNSVLFNVEGSNRKEQLDARHMNTALWAPTWGYFLEQMMSIDGQGKELSETRRHFIDFVRGRGPLPALRIGNQPYGLLPILPLDRWVAFDESQNDSKIVKLLSLLRPVWQRSVKNVPRVVTDGGAGDQLVQALAMSANSLSYSARSTISRNFVQNLSSILNLNQFESWSKQQNLMSRRLLNKLALNINPRICDLVFSPEEVEIRAPLVSEAEDSELIIPDYIRWLQKAKLDDIRAEKLPEEVKPNSLLYLLLRHAILLENANAGSRILTRLNLMQFGERRESEFLDFGARGQTTNIWRRLKSPVPGLTGELSLQEFLSSAKSETTDTVELIEFKKSLAYLAELSASSLAQLLSETLDTCSYRLDAWITSFAMRRLNSIRQKKPIGCYIGGYCWVEDLRPASSISSRSVIKGEIQTKDRSRGYVLAPSLAQATTAAILRAGYLAHKEDYGENEVTNPFAVNLNSARVRMVEWILNGIRNGSSLGALLGYRFERAFQEKYPDLMMAKYIPIFRKLAPVDVNYLASAAEFAERSTSNNIVDGLTLHRLWQEGKIGFRQEGQGLRIEQKLGLPDPQMQKAEHVAVLDELRAIDEVIDALGDSTLAESIYQIVQGNHLRAGSTLDALGLGELPPPQLEVIRTHRTASGITNRVASIFSATTQFIPAWATITAYRPRAQAEPVLNAWVANVLGDPSKVKCHANYIDPKTKQILVPGNIELNLGELNLCPLDFVYLASFGLRDGSEIFERLKMLARSSRPTDVPLRCDINIQFDRQSDWASGTLTVRDFLEVAHSLHMLIVRSRPLVETDLYHPSSDLAEKSAPQQENINALNELKARSHNIIVGLKDTLKMLETVQPGDSAATEAAFLRAADYGVAGCLSVNRDNSIGTTTNNLTSAISEISSRLNEIETPHSSETSIEHEMRSISRLLGGEFRVLPQILLSKPETVELNFSQSDLLQGGDGLAVNSWAQRLSRVREGVNLLERVRTYAESLDRPIQLTVAQSPFVPGDFWAALPFPDEQTLSGDRISFVAYLEKDLNFERAICGLLIDEWNESVPSKQEVAAVTFPFDRPDSRAPQVVLLAVPPQLNTRWDNDALEATILEAIDLTMIRAVDPDSLSEIGHFLPALCFAFNADESTASVDFNRLTDSEKGRP